MMTANYHCSTTNNTLILNAKKLAFKSVPLILHDDPKTKWRSFEKAWSDLQKELQQNNVIGVHASQTDSSSLSSAKTVLEKLTTILSTPFDSEEDFDQSLFTAITECLMQEAVMMIQHHHPLDQMDEHCILFRRDKHLQVSDPRFKHYAVGLARQTAVARDLYRRAFHAETSALSDNNSSSESTRNDENLPYDHAVCLFQKDEHGANDHPWTVNDCFALVELKTTETTCAYFDVTITNVNKRHISPPELSEKHKALGQALLFTLDGVLPFHARRGILDKSLPIAILAGIKKDKRIKPSGTGKSTNNPQAHEPKVVKKPKSLRSVSASIGIPEACGDVVTYSVLDFVKFYNDPLKERKSMERALVLYIDTITFGLKSAFTVLGAIEEDGEMPPPKPASGQRLMIGGNELLDCQFCASPIHGANAFVTSRGPEDGPNKWTVTQGELFRGTLNVHAIDFKEGLIVTFFDKKDRKKNSVKKVIVKVSSVAVHYWLVEPLYAFSALHSIRSLPFSLDVLMQALNATPNHTQAPLFSEERRLIYERAALEKEIGSVLYAAVQTRTGLLTIMADLSAQQYKTLNAKTNSGKLSILWRGFQDLVEHVLLPLASMAIIHADIRPGFDDTANVLFRFVEGEAGDSKASMKLIDYESLVSIQNWLSPRNQGHYICKGGESKWTAETFVWWQCLAVAYAWKEKVTAKTFADDKADNALVVCLKNDFCLTETKIREKETGWKPLLPLKFVQYANDDNISRTVVIETLTELANHFK